MDIERTMEFIVEQQAATAAYLTELREQAKGVDRRLGRLTEQQEKNERQIAGILKLIKMGMKAMVLTDRRMEARFRATDERINALIDAQERSEKKLDRLIQALKGKGRNGRQR
jgi:hypothetical protein